MPIVLRLLVQRRRTTDSLKRVLVQKSAVRVVVIAAALHLYYLGSSLKMFVTELPFEAPSERSFTVPLLLVVRPLLVAVVGMAIVVDRRFEFRRGGHCKTLQMSQRLTQR